MGGKNLDPLAPRPGAPVAVLAACVDHGRHGNSRRAKVERCAVAVVVGGEDHRATPRGHGMAVHVGADGGGQ